MEHSANTNATTRLQKAVQDHNQCARKRRLEEIGEDNLKFEDNTKTLLARLDSDVRLILEVDYMRRTIGLGETHKIVREKAYRFGYMMNQILRDQFLITVGRLFDESPSTISFHYAKRYLNENKEWLLEYGGADPRRVKAFVQRVRKMGKHARKLRQPRNVFIAHNDREVHEDPTHEGFLIGNLTDHNRFLDQLKEAVVLLATCLGYETTEPAAIPMKGDIETVVVALAHLEDDYDWPFASQNPKE